jgi:hypothetical protein
MFPITCIFSGKFEIYEGYKFFVPMFFIDKIVKRKELGKMGEPSAFVEPSRIQMLKEIDQEEESEEKSKIKLGCVGC